jgi:hypothetical protein
MPNEFGKFISLEDFGNVPNEDELQSKWTFIEKDFGENVGGPNDLSNLSPIQKWQIICLYGIQQHNRKLKQQEEDEGGGGFLGNMLQDDDDLQHYMHSPTRWLDRLRDQNAGQFSLDLAGDLKLQLRAASV